MDSENYNIRALSTVLDEFASWYGELLGCLFYPAETSCDDLGKIHMIFDEWLKKTKQQEILEQEYLATIANIHNDLKDMAISLVNHVMNTKSKPDYDSFTKLSALFEEFINSMRRLEKDSVLEGSGIDVLTGLRSKNTLHADLAIEMERLARRGKPFCLALAKIDHYEEIVKQHSRDKARQYTKKVSMLLKKSMRSFDDGYRFGNGEFILCLKQADMSGGLAALERIRKSLESEQVQIMLNGRPQLLTMSCCIAEPLPEDNVDNLIAYLRSDVEQSEKEASGSVFEYHEMSDLERFLQEQAT